MSKNIDYVFVLRTEYRSMRYNVGSLHLFVSNQAPSTDYFSDKEPHQHLNRDDGIKSKILKPNPYD